MGALLLLLLCTVKASASQTAVAKWEFSTGYDVEKSGTTAIYTPNTLGWAQIANTKWSQTQPYFLPNECAMVPEDCKVTVHTSDGKWQVTSSGSAPNYLLRLNTASIDKFTAKADYTDGSKHDQYFEVSLPTTSLRNIKVNFSIGDDSTTTPAVHTGTPTSMPPTTCKPTTSSSSLCACSFSRQRRPVTTT